MSKHTPGPWHADDDEGYSIWRIRGPGRVPARIADVIGDSAETDANAALIAAAPDLLMACKALHYALRRAGGHDALLDEAHDVIAKAEGR